MPELPEVQTVVDTLAPLLCGSTIQGVDLRRKDILLPVDFDFAAAVTGQSITAIHRRAKRIVFTLSDGNRFYIHLGMTGRLSVEDAAAPLLPHTHLLIHTDAGRMHFRDPRRFGGIWWMGKDLTDDIGPEPLGLRTAALARQLARTTRAIKNALLDQSVIAGLGNIYVDESLFTAGIHPLSPANQLAPAQIAKLNRSIKKVLRRALHHRGSTLRDYFDANGNPGSFQKLHAVYDRADLPCRKCKTPIQRIVLGGRSTHFCPRCQQR
jgi:formamidopyrimidine-DNA glycosylase